MKAQGGDMNDTAPMNKRFMEFRELLKIAEQTQQEVKDFYFRYRNFPPAIAPNSSLTAIAPDSSLTVIAPNSENFHKIVNIM